MLPYTDDFTVEVPEDAAKAILAGDDLLRVGERNGASASIFYPDSYEEPDGNRQSMHGTLVSSDGSVIEAEVNAKMPNHNRMVDILRKVRILPTPVAVFTGGTLERLPPRPETHRQIVFVDRKIARVDRRVERRMRKQRV